MQSSEAELLSRAITTGRWARSVSGAVASPPRHPGPQYLNWNVGWQQPGPTTAEAARRPSQGDQASGKDLSSSPAPRRSFGVGFPGSLLPPKYVCKGRAGLQHRQPKLLGHIQGLDNKMSVLTNWVLFWTLHTITVLIKGCAAGSSKPSPTVSTSCWIFLSYKSQMGVSANSKSIIMLVNNLDLNC